MNNILDRYTEQRERIDNLNQEIFDLRMQNEHLKNENNRIISEPYYIKAMDFRIRAKKTLLYAIYKRLRYGKMAEERIGIEGAAQGQEECKKEFNYDYMLGINEYRFLRYKKKRNHGFKLDLNRIGVPYKKDMISVVLPVYNGDDYVELAVESVLTQTYTNFELIIVDDGSTDKTPQIVDNYAKLDKRVKVIHQENRKLPRTLSRGFREARGEFLTWTSADNIMHPQFLQRFVEDLKKYSHTGMIYGNMKLIDEKGNPKTDFGWYTDDPEHLENVQLPRSILELNTYANNHIGAAFMYRAVVAAVVEDYSAYKYGIEDYDYWMKVNELFTLRHTSFDEPEYSYRMHAKSLTSRDKELKITENRFKQMLLDEFRRDYYLKEMIWVVESTDNNNVLYHELLDAIHKYGHRALTVDQAKRQTINLYERLIYVYFSSEDNTSSSRILENAFQVFVSNKPIKMKNAENWDMYICNSSVTDKDFEGAYKGWFGIEAGEDLFAFVDAKARNLFLYDLEADGVLNNAHKKTFSVIISYSGEPKKLKTCIQSIKEKEDVELIIVGGNSEKNLIREWNIKNGSYISCIAEDDISRKNIAARKVTGKYLVFVEDDCCFEESYFESLKEAFLLNKKVAVVFGNVELSMKSRYRGYEELLGEYHIEEDDIYQYHSQNIPSAYSFAIRNDFFKMAGGFYHLSEKNAARFCPEAFFGMAMVLKNVGYYIYLSSECRTVRLIEDIKIEELSKRLLDKRISDYNLKLNNVLPYDIWPEGLESECRRLLEEWKSDQSDQWKHILYDCNQKLLDSVRKDFQEREKVDLNRDLFSQLV